jgi:hypothetical protein
VRKSSQAKLHYSNDWDDNVSADELGLTGSSSFAVERHSKATNISLYRGPEGYGVDPFCTLPIGEAGQTQFLIYHCEFMFNNDMLQPRQNIDFLS